MIIFDRQFSTNKEQLLAYFRGRAIESIGGIRRIYGTEQIREQASAINKAIVETKNTLVKALAQKFTIEKWQNEEILRSVLMITYTSYVVMIDARNEIWPYDFMSFSCRKVNCGNLFVSSALSSL